MKLEDKQKKTASAGKTAGATGSTATRPAPGAARAVAAEELDPGRERRPLESYFQEIGGTRTLRREEEVAGLLVATQ